MERAGCSPPTIRLHPFLAPRGTDLTQAVAHQTYPSLLPHSKSCVCHRRHLIVFTSLHDVQCFVKKLQTISLLVYLLIYLLTHSTEQSHTIEANRFSTSQEILRILWNPKVSKQPVSIMFPHQNHSYNSLVSHIRATCPVQPVPTPRSQKFFHLFWN